jgi:CMP-N-acetylneuraminic acid synthetase
MALRNKIKILGIIPARGGSKGIPRKNIAPLLGRPLIWYTIREAKKSRLLDAFIVSTDDPKIAAVTKKFGADVPFLRPKKYARDTSRDIEFLQHALSWVKKHRGWDPEIVVFLQPTSPSRTAQDIDDVLEFMQKTKCDSVRTVVDPAPYNPFKMVVARDTSTMKITDHFAPKKLGANMPRQLLPAYFQPIGLVYATKASCIRKGQLWGNDARGFVVPREKLTDIDIPADLKRAEETLKKLRLE